jgi:hypothetical protein
MPDLIIPGWLAYIIIGIYLPWLIWLTLKTNRHEKNIAINFEGDKSHNIAVEKAEQRFEAALKASEERVTKSIEKLQGKMDLFVSDEVTILKQMLKK